jgi:hypothetical protein
MKPLLLSETSDNYETRESARNHLYRVSNLPKSPVFGKFPNPAGLAAKLPESPYFVHFGIVGPGPIAEVVPGSATI